MRQMSVKSRIIQSVYFSQDDGQLRICFKNGEQRRFTGVSEQAVVAMCASPSPGQFYIDHIRTAYKRLAA
jgi:hypothetical protein